MSLASTEQHVVEQHVVEQRVIGQRAVGQRAVERRLGPPARRAAAAAVPSRSVVRALRQFLHAQRDGWVLETRLMLAACLMAGEARRCGLPPERMLVVLKRTWWTLDELRRLPRIEAQEWLSRLVSLSIRAYYEPRRGAVPRLGSHGGDGARRFA
jgi:hypothetical protein